MTTQFIAYCLKLSIVIQRAPKLSREDEELVPSLYDQINKLKSQNNVLADRNKEISETLEKKKRELAISKKVLQTKRPPSILPYSNTKDRDSVGVAEVEIRAGPTKHSHQTTTHTPPMPVVQSATVTPDQNTTSSITPDAHLLEIARKYKERSPTRCHAIYVC